MADQDNSVYYPEQIADQPLPTTGQVATPVNQQGSDPLSQSNSTPATSLEEKFPPRIIAQETVSSALNTRTKKIKQEFTFSPTGAIRIGQFLFGVSGEVDISPNGITGVDVNGDTTFVIDATTGDAFFKGKVGAGTLLAGDSNVMIDGDENGGRIVIFVDGIPRIIMGVA